MSAKLRSLHILILLFFGVVNKGFSQDEAKPRMVIFKFSPLVMFEPVGGYQIGAEFPVKQNLSIQAEYAYLPYYWDADFGEMRFFSRRQDFNAWALKAELRFYFTDSEGKGVFSSEYMPDLQGFYVASQMQVKKITEVDSSVQWSSTGEEQYEQYTLRTTIVKINVKAGYQHIMDNGFVLDCYTGFGFRFWDMDIDPNVTYYVPYGYSPINFALGAKIGWAF